MIALCRVAPVQKWQGSASVMLLQTGTRGLFLLLRESRPDQRERLFAIHSQQIKREALRRLRPDAGQALELVESDLSYGRGKIRAWSPIIAECFMQRRG